MEHGPERRRPLDLDDAPTLDASDEAALDAIRRQLEEEFGGAALAAETPELPVEVDRAREPGPPIPPEPRTSPRAEARSRPALDGHPRPRSERDVRGRLARSRAAWAAHERLREERAARLAREPMDRLPTRRIPAQWREAQWQEAEEAQTSESRPRRGLFVTFCLVAGLAGGAAGALLTVLLLTDVRSARLQESWSRVVEAARESGVLEVAGAVAQRARRADPPTTTSGPARESAAPASRPRHAPVTTSEIPDPGPAPGGPGDRAARPGAPDLRDLVAAGRRAYVERDYATAERLFASAVQRSLGDGLLRYHHAIALMGLGRFSEARVEFRNALRLGVDTVVADEARQALEQLNTARRRR